MSAPRPLPDVSEADFQKQVVELAGICGWHHLHVRRTIGRGRKWTTSTNLAGWPDLLLWRTGEVIAAELKSERGVVSPEQCEVLDSLRDAGVRCFVWRPSDFEAIAKVLSPGSRAGASDEVLDLRAEVAVLRRRCEVLMETCPADMGEIA
jgi:hypothetical protein